METMMKTALVTGGLRGIGLGISKSLLAEGYMLALCGTREIERVGRELDELRSQSSDNQKVVYYCCDIGNRNDRRELVQKVRNDFRQLNLLVNNAGVTAKVRDDLLTMTEENYDWLMKINLQGPFFLTQEVVYWMIEQKRMNSDFFGSIINISSISATAASLNRGEYCISKAALSMTTRLWSLRLAEYGISVYEIRPGLIRSDMTSGVAEKYSKLIQDGFVPQQRWGLPEDVGRAVAMLARGDLAYSTGQVIMIDGGMMIPKL
ncbi:MAG: 3-ketoacyl-ACP reductase [Planctomycetaceae bacterium]|jgi:NAD(P)-dependent dehydrogenase (short-subunit alcohol dehydrogenase family)|nr:3-ketoacyl-ACP reductase [Planctomycetaceae bacterium]